VALLPIHNEAVTLLDVLERVAPRVDGIICVDDASTDATPGILRAFARKHPRTRVVTLPENQGMAGALKTGFLLVQRMFSQGLLKGEDLVVTLDADGQHRPEYIPELERHLRDRDVDVVLTRRDFSVYPAYKILGNAFLTLTNSILSGRRYHDVESGLRMLKVRTILPILRFYTGSGYSCAQEIALISARLGFRIDNDLRVRVDHYRPGTTVWDGFIVLFYSLLAYGRCRLGLEVRLDLDPPSLDGFRTVPGRGRRKARRGRRGRHGT
jgi:glycosyltransferase involved in cell wall biosynthesis